MSLTVIYMSEQPDHPGFVGLAQHKIGDTVKVIKVTLTHNDEDDTREAFLSVLGKVVEIKEISLWEGGAAGTPWHINYEIELSNCESVFLNNDEIESHLSL